MMLLMNIPARIGRYTESLRFPVLLLLTGLIFIVDLFVPDVIPFVDEIILGLLVALLARMRKPLAKSKGRATAKSSPPDGDPPQDL
jgi:hypothetical protein